MQKQPFFKTRRDTEAPPTDGGLIAGMASRLHLGVPERAPEPETAPEAEHDVEPSM
jgi:hypothetical protein